MLGTAVWSRSADDVHKHLCLCTSNTFSHTLTHICELMLPPVPPWCMFHTPPPLPPWRVKSDAVCRAQPCLSAAWSQMAWCGWLWLRLLSRPDHCMMNHIPAASSNCTHARSQIHQISAQLRAIPAREATVLLPCCAWRLILTSQQGSRRPHRGQEKLKIHQGAKGRREKAEPQPSAVRVSLLLSL